MLLTCDISAARGYTSQAQISRVLSEAWFCENGYCLSCDNDTLSQMPANTKAADFACGVCEAQYELKTFRSMPRRTLVDGAYCALISRIESGWAPTLVLLERNSRWEIQGLTAIHHLFLTPSVVERRKPLSPSARRAGWVGCNIRLDLMGSDAQVKVIDRGVPLEWESVRESFQRFESLKEISPESRGWATLTLAVVRSLGCREFSLNDVYEREQTFADSYPKNSNIRAKVRQQLQVLRDLGCVQFRGHGHYRLLL